MMISDVSIIIYGRSKIVILKNRHFKNSHSGFKRLSPYFNNFEFTVMYELYTILIRCAMVDIKGCCAMVDINIVKVGLVT